MDGPTSMQPHTKMCQMETHASTGGYVPQSSSMPRLASLASRVSCNAARSSLAGELAGLDLAACTISAHSFVITVPLYGIRLPQLLSVDPATLYTSPLFFVSLAPSHPLQVLSHYARGHGTSPYFSSARWSQWAPRLPLWVGLLSAINANALYPNWYCWLSRV